MSKRYKRILSITLAFLLLLGFLWYVRPRPLSQFLPEGDITCIGLAVSRLNTDFVGKPRDTHQKSLLPGDPVFDTVLSDLQTLRFRQRPLRDLFYQLDSLDSTSFRSKELHDGGYSVFLSIFTGENNHCALILQFWIDEWTMDTITEHGSRSHMVFLSNGQDAAITLFDSWWALLPADDGRYAS